MIFIRDREKVNDVMEFELTKAHASWLCMRIRVKLLREFV